MADKAKAGVFVRESTGLVKNVSLLNALTLNMGNMSAGAALATIGFTMASLTSVGGVNLVYASIIAFLLSVPQIIVYTLMGSKIKRTGGDYVWITRSFGGALGGSLSFMGYVLETQVYFALIVLSMVFAIGSVGVAMGNSSFLGLALPGNISGSVPAEQFAVGAVIFLILILANMIRPKVGYRIVTFTILIGVIGILVAIATLLSAGQTGVANYINNIGAVDFNNNPITFNSLVSSYSGSTFNFGATISILPFFAIFVYPWINAGPAVGSELKGTGTARWNVPLASILVLVLLTGAFATMYYVAGLPFTNAALGNAALVFNYSFNFWTLAMGVSGNTALQLFIGLSWILWNVGILAYGVIVISRYLLAQAFDRFLPEKIAYVNKWGAPVVAQAIVLILTLSLVGAVSFLYGTLQALYAGVIAAMIYFVFIGLTAIIHGSKNERGTNRGLLVVCGLLMSLVFAYITYQFLASPALWGTSTVVNGVPGYDYAYAYVAASFVAGLALYYGCKAYYGRRGIDVTLAYKEIPPE
ncbi:MAG: APC family permease [Nitrososphaerota archaeon]|nr:APC family permease [Nitrososphaerota archaeon]